MRTTLAGCLMPHPSRAVWTDRVTPLTIVWRDVAWSPALGLFAAVGDSGQSATSPDGVTWTARTMPSNGSWDRIVWAPELGLFCCLKHNSANAATSPDGVTWTQRTLSISATLWGGLAWNGSVFVAVPNSPDDNRTLTSADGITWTTHTAALPVVGPWQNCVWAAELGLFLEIQGEAGGHNVAATSPDGVTWTQRTLPASRFWRQASWNGSLFVLVDYTASSTNYATSPDGINWTARNFPAVSVRWASSVWNPTHGVFCVVGYGTLSLISPDGIIWSQHPFASNHDWYNVAWSPFRRTFVCVPVSSSSVVDSWRYQS